MNILGISCYYHDASASLVQDGKIIAAAEEERFTRKKHDNRFPELSIAYCLKEAGLKASNIDLVSFYEKPLLKLERALINGIKWKDKSTTLFKKQISKMMHEDIFLTEALKDKIGYMGKVVFTEHHLAHAASSYYISKFDRAAILVVDGVGEYATTSMFSGEENKIHKLQEIHYPDSLGLLYSTLTAFLGFKVNNDEYKVMGLASYGQPRHIDKLNKIIAFYDDGSFRLNMDYFCFMYDGKQMFNSNFIELFGQPRSNYDKITSYHMDIAASLQHVLEDGMIRLGNALYNKTKVENVCLSGGVALNCVANWEFIKRTPFSNICIQPAAGDAGGSVGAALYAYFHNRIQPRDIEEYSAFLGPGFSNQEIKGYLDSVGASHTMYDEEGICRKTADLIYKDQIIGWFQGRMEYGPRALGHRSILANPCNPTMKDVLNERVKFREDFRPFAPAILSERAQEYFDIPFDSPYMLFICNVKTGIGSRIPSVTHVDNTARLQTVSNTENPMFHRLIESFENISGVPIVINTSFNIRGEPIVCTPEDAYNCFMKTDIDYLVMGNYLVEKEF